MARISRTTRNAQTGWRVFITPGWVITFLLVTGFSYAAFTILSPWQLGKDAQIVNRNNHIEDAFNVDPKPYSDIFTSDGVIKDDQEWMRVTLTGRYLTDKEVILRLRPVESTPALQALTPFQLDSGEIILVNRGFEPTTADKETTIPPAPTGEVTILAHARVDEQQPQTAPRTDVDPKQVYGINTEQIGQIEGLTLAKDYVQLSDNQPGLLHFIPIPKLDRGNHLSYGSNGSPLASWPHWDSGISSGRRPGNGGGCGRKRPRWQHRPRPPRNVSRTRNHRQTRQPR